MIKAFVAFSKNNEVVKKSSSGGVFYHIGKNIIERGGVVFGATIDKYGNVYHTKAQNLTELNSLLKSKYVESVVGDTYNETLKFLEKGRLVLYSGTPCQIAGLKKIAGENKNLILVDLICHGVPDRKYWKMYLESIGDKPPYISLDFRNKSTGWEDFSLQINNSIETKWRNKYLNAFLNNSILCNKCYHCRFKGENRCSDIVLGDGWGVNNYSNVYNNNGTSLVIQRNDKFNFLSMKNSLVIKEVDYSVATFYFNPAYHFAVSKPNKVFTSFDDMGIDNGESRIGSFSNIFKKIIKSASIRMYRHYKIVRNRKYDIGIVTCYGFYNFGNKLQNYALHHILRGKGYKTINMIPLRYDSSPWIFVVNHLKRRRARECCIYRASTKYEKKYVPMFAQPKKYNHINNVLVGSDQVWNPYFDCSYSLGLFFDRNNLNSYAASFGVSKLDGSFTELYKQQLNKYSNISVREKSGQSIVNELGYNSSIDLDPTLLLDLTEWNNVVKKRAKRHLPKESYYVKYMLRNADYDFNDLNMSKIDLLDEHDYYYISNQFDFVNIIFHSKYVVTDSFHATVFSLLSGKKVHVVYGNESNMKMVTRFDTLISLCDSNKVKKELEYIIFEENALNQNKLDKLRYESINHLLNMFKK